jgi:hypothetical protein
MAAGPAYSPIATYTIAGGTAASYTFTSIPQTYTDLILVSRFAGNYSSNDRSQLVFQVGNNSIDAGANYSLSYLSANGTSATTGRDNNVVSLSLATYPLGPSSDVQQNTLVTHFMNYSNTTTFKSIVARGTQMNSSNNTPATTVYSALWKSTSAINQIRIKDYGDLYYFYPGTSFTLYGITAA